MSSRYSAPSVEPILEDSEDEGMVDVRAREEELPSEISHHRHRLHESTMKANSGREREKSRKHRSTNVDKYSKKPKNASGKRAGATTSRGNMPDSSYLYQRSRSASSSASEEEEDHRAILAAARARLTSPSSISNFTSSSSGSNSTVTQASISKRMSLVKKPETADEPLSPAVPDPPNVFSFLEKDSPNSDQKEESNHRNEEPRWTRTRNEPTLGVAPVPPQESNSSASSASSSFHGDDTFSEPAADNDTDRSSSPERNAKGPYEGRDIPQKPLTDQVSTKVASQMAAAHHRQNLCTIQQQFGKSETTRQPNQSHAPSTVLSARHSHHPQQQMAPYAENYHTPPITGYQALASRLAYSSNVDQVQIKPMYRKFEALNHRLLLHLQDELSELEEQLRRLDHADTQARRTNQPGVVMPASRRAAAQAGGELEWYRTDILGRIGFKLNQYNAALASFNSTQSLAHPTPSDIDHYREYLQSEHLIAEPETHFLDPTDDLVSLCSEQHTASSQSESSYTPSSASSFSAASSISSNHSSLVTPKQTSSPATQGSETSMGIPSSALPAIATAIALAILVPILTFNVIPGFLGRMTVSLLVCLFMIWALIQSETIARTAPLEQEGVTCLSIYGGVMTVIAGIMA